MYTEREREGEREIRFRISIYIHRYRFNPTSKFRLQVRTFFYCPRIEEQSNTWNMFLVLNTPNMFSGCTAQAAHRAARLFHRNVDTGPKTSHRRLV